MSSLTGVDDHAPSLTRAESHGFWRKFLAVPAVQQQTAGYYHTVREILQQPDTWLDTARRMVDAVPQLSGLMDGCKSIAFTGSGSSEYAARCIDLALQQAVRIPVETVAGGRLLALGEAALFPLRPTLLVSLARSGNSPESIAALQQLLPVSGIRHLVITCNATGALANTGDPAVTVLVLDESTNDRSLVMTSSFTNLVVGAHILGFLDTPQIYLEMVRSMGEAASALLFDRAAAIEAAARVPFRSVVYLGTGANEGAAREAALKMLEITGGQVQTMAESFLGLRHGPMSAIHTDTLIVGLLSSDPHVRAYEMDLLEELDRKRLGIGRVVVGSDVPASAGGPEAVRIDLPAVSGGSEHASVLHVVAGQLLALFRCMQQGSRPDEPSDSGVITRVVNTFRIFDRGGKASV